MKYKKITQEQINEIIRLHELWLATYGQKGKRANLKGDFTKVDFKRANLTEADLTGNFTGVNFTGVNLTGAYLTRANLTGANLTGNFIEVNLTEANLTGANLKGDFTKADFMEANLTEANLMGNFTEVNFTRADFMGAYLMEADLKGTILTDVKFSEELENIELWLDNRFEKIKYKGQEGWKVRKGISVKTPYAMAYEKKFGSPRKGQCLIEENIDKDRRINCGEGLNFATKRWFDKGYYGYNWACFLPKDNIIIIPYGTDGKARARKLILLERIK